MLILCWDGVTKADEHVADKTAKRIVRFVLAILYYYISDCFVISNATSNVQICVKMAWLLSVVGVGVQAEG